MIAELATIQSRWQLRWVISERVSTLAGRPVGGEFATVARQPLMESF